MYRSQSDIERTTSTCRPRGLKGSLESTSWVWGAVGELLINQVSLSSAAPSFRLLFVTSSYICDVGSALEVAFSFLFL
eukprot:COSAG01_NODE_1261_length_11001_cov_11.811961_12_plen_78_part_00